MTPPQPPRLVDLTHVVEEGMVTYPGLPGPELGIHLSREASRAVYAEGTQFEIGRISMVTNTGTYLDAPWHRFADGADLAGVPLERVAALPGVVIDVCDRVGPHAPQSVTGAAASRGIDVQDVAGLDVAGRAVLLRTGWDELWRTPGYGQGSAFLTGAGARALADAGAALVGIDAVNIDDVGDGTRPAHTTLLAAGIGVLEHLTNLVSLPPTGFELHAAPVPVRRLGTFPVRAYAVVRDDGIPSA